MQNGNARVRDCQEISVGKQTVVARARFSSFRPAAIANPVENAVRAHFIDYYVAYYAPAIASASASAPLPLPTRTQPAASIVLIDQTSLSNLVEKTERGKESVIFRHNRPCITQQPRNSGWFTSPWLYSLLQP